MGLKQAIGSAILAAAGLWLIGCFQSANASSVDGSWKIRDLVLDIFSCQQSICGKIAWTKDPHRRQTVNRRRNGTPYRRPKGPPWLRLVPVVHRGPTRRWVPQEADAA